jgi:hypothetical protein
MAGGKGKPKVISTKNKKVVEIKNSNHSGSGNNKTIDTNRCTSVMKTVVLILLPILIFSSMSYYIYTSIYLSRFDTCDMNKAENRDFNKFYGITELKSHFTTSVADECNSNIIFQSIFPQTILKSDNSPSSFMILAKFGTGKTLLRCQYFKSLKSN